MKPHLKLHNLTEVVSEAKNIWNTIDHSTENNEDIKFYRQASKTMGHYSLGKVTPRWNYFRDHFKELSDIPMLIEFYTGMEKYYKSSPHTDRGRSVAINVPVEVDLQHSNAFFGKYFELDKYPTPTNHGYEFTVATKETNYKKEINERYQGNYEPEYYDDVDLDCAVLFDPAVPHGGWNKADTQRVIMSISFEEMDYNYAYNKCIELGWTGEIS